MKNSLFDSLFSSESCVYSPPLEKVPFMALYSNKIGVGRLLDDVGFVPHRFMCKNLSFHSFLEP